MQVESATFSLPAPLPLECDELLLAPQVAYETYGAAREGTAVLLLHGLSRSHRAASGEPAGPGKLYAPDAWFSSLVGPGKALNTDLYQVISCDLLGSPWGSTSPLSLHPEYEDIYGGTFFPLTVTDQARAAATLCRGLGVKRLHAVVGVSLGGMVALRLAGLFPELVGAVASLGASAALPDATRRRLATVRQVLEADRAYRGGFYESSDAPRATLKRLRLEHLREVVGPDDAARRHGDLFAVERALETEAEQFAAAFDARCYATLCETYARADLFEHLGKVRGRALLMASASDQLAPPERVRDTYHRLMASGTSARYYELQSEAGHRAFYRDSPRVGETLREFIGTPR